MTAPAGRLRPLLAEFFGTAGLLAVVVGSGIMGERLAGGNDAIALLANSLATAAGLTVLILSLGPISGAHFNPVVTALACLRRDLTWSLGLRWMAVQVAGALAGVLLAHGMFDETLLQVSGRSRTGTGQVLSELVATAGLLATIRLCMDRGPQVVGPAVGIYIGGAYWFTASTSFANPAVTLARQFTDTFAGIAPGSVPGFLAAQMLGLTAVALLLGWLRRT